MDERTDDLQVIVQLPPCPCVAGETLATSITSGRTCYMFCNRCGKIRDDDSVEWDHRRAVMGKLYALPTAELERIIVRYEGIAPPYIAGLEPPKGE